MKKFKDTDEHIIIFLFQGILILVGLGAFMFPEELWRSQTFMSVSGGEPTDYAIFSNKLVGIGLFSYPLVV